MAMLEVKDLEVYYGMIQAIKGISFEVMRRGYRSDRSQWRRKNNYTSHNHRTPFPEERTCNV